MKAIFEIDNTSKEALLEFVDVVLNNNFVEVKSWEILKDALVALNEESKSKINGGKK